MRARQYVLAAVAGLTATVAAQAQSTTVATFADPTIGGPLSPLFTYNGDNTAGVLSGGWAGTGLNLQTPGIPFVPDYADATFTMSSVSTTVPLGGGLFLTSGGTINFFDSASNPLLTINFTGGFLSSALGFGASDFTGFNVTFSGPILAAYGTITNEAFSFSFANPALTSTGFSVTSSFTSSAELVIPAPASAALLGLGGLIAARRRR